ncbi:MAG: 50S ribosomal protein L29 [Bdellovibrionaceae bacterium]|nr:50S ribosomal protein L29 [Pseudobdellovibrionaceae bacterium]
MKYEEIAGMTAKDLNQKKSELRQSLFEARMKNALGQLTNPMEIRAIRRSIARLNTAAAAKVAGALQAGKKASAKKAGSKAKAKG